MNELTYEQEDYLLEEALERWRGMYKKQIEEIKKAKDDKAIAVILQGIYDEGVEDAIDNMTDGCDCVREPIYNEGYD